MATSSTVHVVEGCLARLRLRRTALWAVVPHADVDLAEGAGPGSSRRLRRPLLGLGSQRRKPLALLLVGDLPTSPPGPHEAVLPMQSLPGFVLARSLGRTGLPAQTTRDFDSDSFGNPPHGHLPFNAHCVGMCGYINLTRKQRERVKVK